MVGVVGVLHPSGWVAHAGDKAIGDQEAVKAPAYCIQPRSPIPPGGYNFVRQNVNKISGRKEAIVEGCIWSSRTVTSPLFINAVSDVQIASDDEVWKPETILGCCIMPGLIQPNLSHKASKVSPISIKAFGATRTSSCNFLAFTSFYGAIKSELCLLSPV